MSTSTVQNVAGLLDRTAHCWPGLPAVAVGARVFHDYASLARRAANLAGAFAASGLAPGDRIALVSRNVPEYIEALFGCWWAGIVAVPVNAKLHAKELAYVLGDSGARWVFVDAAWHASLGEASGVDRVIEFGSAEYSRLHQAPSWTGPFACIPEHPAWLFYTSGTTGRPKGVVITHANLRAMSQGYLSDVETVAPGDAILHPAPLSHGSGLYVLPHVLAGAVNVIPDSGGFDAPEIAALLHAWDRASFFAAPTMVKRLVTSRALGAASLARLKCLIYGGGPMYVADCKEAFKALGPRLAQIYGQGESPMTITAMNRALLSDAIARGNDARIGSVGVAQTGIEVRIAAAKPESAEPGAAAGEMGEVLVRGPTVMRGYWNNPEATAHTLAGGWLHTGDVGCLDDDGFLTLKDRSKDLIISGGSNIYPREVEEVLLLNPDVIEAAVIGRVHPEWGEEVIACVVARSEVSASAEGRAAFQRALDALCLEHIARFKRPKTYVFLAELPKNNAGKILKTVLREKYGDPSFTPPLP